MNLYEIDKAILACIDHETGEVIDDKALNDLAIAKDQKIENIGLYIKNLRSEETAYRAEKEAFYAKEKAARAKSESLRRYLASALRGDTYKSTRVRVSYRKSQSVECEDVNKVDRYYLRFKDPELDKDKIKRAIKDGVDVVGCSLVEKQNIQIG